MQKVEFTEEQIFDLIIWAMNIGADMPSGQWLELAEAEANRLMLDGLFR